MQSPTPTGVAAATSLEEPNMVACPEDENDPPDRFINHYRCPLDDGGCGHEWTDTSPYTNNDHCPICDLGDIEPYQSEDL